MASARSRRPHPILLVLLGLTLAAFVLIRLGGSAGPGTTPSNVRGAPQGSADAGLDPTLLDVRLEQLSQERPAPGTTERNPFRFQQRPAPPRPAQAEPLPTVANGPVGPIGPAAAPSSPPITVRFIGLLDHQNGSQVAIFVDCSVGRRQMFAREGEVVDGRYRLVKIGLESVVVEHLDGRGRTTLAQTGQECVGK